jgi:hypothetical protein
MDPVDPMVAFAQPAFPVVAPATMGRVTAETSAWQRFVRSGQAVIGTMCLRCGETGFVPTRGA